MAIKTKDLIIKSFFELLGKNNIEQITVTDLVERCDISRQTFYYHFKDIPSMLEWIFNNSVETALVAVEKTANVVDSMRVYAAFTKEIHPIIEASLKTGSFITVYNLIYNSYKKIANSILTKYYQLSDKAKHYSVIFWASSLCGLTINEAQKKAPDYDTLFKMVGASFSKS
ncbi:MAG: TetR family transcriptional regulator [Eubacterium sp.]